MRLLNTTTFEFEQFLGDDVPRYAILSHTWGKDELTFQDMLTGNATNKAGFTKLQGFCALAKHYELDFAWMDTCCIDKSSSSELSEAINSMYRWYRKSIACFAYLEDVHDGDDVEKEESQFRQSRWFTRGWTLQELIAPDCVYLISTDWKIFGHKLAWTDAHGQRERLQIPNIPDLRDLISNITGISLEVLTAPRKLETRSVAQRMSWAAFRKTTRPEDAAYCLMGIFDINMPLLYGEGEKKAFNRLQEEILRVTEDDTLFMHICSEKQGCFCFTHPPLASSPWGFRGLGAIENGYKEPIFHDRTISSQMTPKGLRVQLPICPCEIELDYQGVLKKAYIAILDCSIAGQYLNRGVIVLRKNHDGTFARWANSRMARLEPEKQEIVFQMQLSKIRKKVVSIQLDMIRLETIHIIGSISKPAGWGNSIPSHMNLIFQGIEQPAWDNVVLRDEDLLQPAHNSFIRWRHWIAEIKACFFEDEANGDAFIGILGVTKDISCSPGDQSVPYCKVFMKEPKQDLRNILREEKWEVMHREAIADELRKWDGHGQPPFSLPPSLQRATLALKGSREAVVTINSKRFLEREEHGLKLEIRKKSS